MQTLTLTRDLKGTLKDGSAFQFHAGEPLTVESVKADTLGSFYEIRTPKGPATIFLLTHDCGPLCEVHGDPRDTSIARYSFPARTLIF